MARRSVKKCSACLNKVNRDRPLGSGMTRVSVCAVFGNRGNANGVVFILGRIDEISKDEPSLCTLWCQTVKNATA